MAVTKVEKQVLGINNFADIEFTALTSATDGFEAEWHVKDERTVLLIKNTGSSAVTVTVKKGEGLQGVKDLSYSVAGSAVSGIVIDSGSFKNFDSTVKVTASATGVSAALVELY